MFSGLVPVTQVASQDLAGEMPRFSPLLSAFTLESNSMTLDELHILAKLQFPH